MATAVHPAPSSQAAAGTRARISLPRFKFLRRHAGWVFFALFAIFSAGIAFFSIHMSRAAVERSEAEQWHIHAMEVLLAAEEFRVDAFDVLRGERGYLLTNNEEFLQPYIRGRADAPLRMRELQELVSDNPAQAHAAAEMAKRLDSFLDIIDRAVELARSGRQEEALAVVRAGQGRQHFERLNASVQRLEAEERGLLIARRETLEDAARQTDRLGQLAGIINIILFAIAALAAVWAQKAQRRAAKAIKDLKRLATVDDLTGLPNRRRFLERLEEESARARREGSALCLATLDIDHFKRINDTHGHPAGDAVLRQLSRVIREKIRLGDSAARLGGEEFALLLPSTNAHQARLVCDRLRAAVAARPFELPDGGALRVTLSTGVALLQPGDDCETLMRRSDEALYDAKAGGRNQVRLAA